MEKNKTVRVNSGGLGFGTVLFLIFLVLKLTDQIDWSWWWVTSPLWIPFAMLILFMGFFAFIAFIAILLNDR